MHQLLEALTQRVASGQWEPIALRILYNRLHRLLRDLVACISIKDTSKPIDELIESVQQGVVGEVRAHVDELMGSQDNPSVANLLVLEERLTTVIARLAP